MTLTIRPTVLLQSGLQRSEAERTHRGYLRVMATGDAPHGEHDHSKTEPAVREILAGVGLSTSGLRWIPSLSHSAWMTDEVVVRYRVIGPTGRLTHESKVAALLPSEALYPTVVAVGCEGKNDWLVTERVPGAPLPAVWARLSEQERETATHELAVAARALHGAPAQHLRPPGLYGGAPVVARTAFVDTLAEIASEAPDAASSEVERLLRLLDDHREAIDDEPSVMAHHDLNFGQCIWRDGHLVGLVDLEMSHANSADWDLVDLLGSCASPTYWRGVRAEDFAHVGSWFEEAYPTPFAHPALHQRLRVYDLIYKLASLRRKPDVALMLATLASGTPYEYLLPR